MNAYATLAEYKAFVTSRQQSPTDGGVDDGVITDLLLAASRYYDTQTGRKFYPSVYSRSYDTPTGRTLAVDFDLLEVISITNGAGASITDSDYIFEPRNTYPKFAVKLKETSDVIWDYDESDGIENAISLVAVGGYHPDYDDAWEAVTTLGAGLNNSALTATVASSSLLQAGQIVMVDYEIMHVSAITSTSVTMTKRGANGSAAASHLNGATVYVWRPIETLKQAVLETAMRSYKRRFGQSVNDSQTVTAAGVVLMPRDIPAIGTEFIASHRRIV